MSDKMYEVDRQSIVAAIAACDFILLTRDFTGFGQLERDTVAARHKLHEALGDDGLHIPTDPMSLFRRGEMRG